MINKTLETVVNGIFKSLPGAQLVGAQHNGARINKRSAARGSASPYLFARRFSPCAQLNAGKRLHIFQQIRARKNTPLRVGFSAPFSTLGNALKQSLVCARSPFEFKELCFYVFQ